MHQTIAGQIIICWNWEKTYCTFQRNDRGNVQVIFKADSENKWKHSTCQKANNSNNVLYSEELGASLQWDLRTAKGQVLIDLYSLWQWFHPNEPLILWSNQQHHCKDTHQRRVGGKTWSLDYWTNTVLESSRTRSHQSITWNIGCSNDNEHGWAVWRVQTSQNSIYSSNSLLAFLKLMWVLWFITRTFH